jgi:hypothetical protein
MVRVPKQDVIGAFLSRMTTLEPPLLLTAHRKARTDMHIHTFQLDFTGASILTLAQDQIDGPLIVALNSIQLGILNTRAEFEKGRIFTLEDGSSVTVRVLGEQVEVWLDGKRLVASTAEIATPPEAAPLHLLIKRLLV